MRQWETTLQNKGGGVGCYRQKPPGERGEGGSPAENCSGEELQEEKAPLKALHVRGEEEKKSASQIS